MNKSLSWILILIAVVTVGAISFSLGRASAPIPESSDSITAQVKSDLVSLTQKDFEEYQNLRTLEERYKKADEILGKIVVVFLADLGVKLAFKSTDPTQLDSACILPPTTPPMATPSPPKIQAAVLAEEKTLPTAKAQPEWINQEKGLLEIRDEHLALEELKKMGIKDLYSTLREGTALSTKNSSGILGTYAGEITFFDRKKHKTDWLITWDVRLRNPNKEDAYALVVLSRKDNGDVISRSQTSRGPLQDYMTVSGSNALIVNIRTDKAYAQIYPLNGNTQIWVGNVYEQLKIGEYALVGQVRLVRQ